MLARELSPASSVCSISPDPSARSLRLGLPARALIKEDIISNNSNYTLNHSINALMGLSVFLSLFILMGG
jgi:hypothetical protein